ncbi:MAG: hypothetical protein CBD88_00980 [Flavobacteriales bacterium TMED228]|nr:MAG: hypothetical protein CBD88_00980 [Flavobacteriales bacterium TMED228]|tara:strand:+ start:8609 stop:10771 length:2163 start_codon:yes stop_codon:yes gene_type:complete
MSENNLTANSVYFQEEPEEQGIQLTLDENLRNNFVGLINDRFTTSESSRDLDESRWLTSYHNYRGLYGKNIRFRESEKSRVFVKVTKTKVLAAFGQLVDVVFGANKFPIGITETKLPEGVLKYAHVDVQNPLPGLETTQEEIKPQDSPYDVGYEGDGKVLKAGATFNKGKFEDTPVEVELEEQGKLKEGASPNPQFPETSPAQEAARRMEQLIHDQIEESNGASEIRNSLFEAALFGTGIVKGPFNFNKTLHRWTQSEDGSRGYDPIDVRVPRLEFVSIWDFFPDPNATSIAECEYIFHRHRMNRTQLRGLIRMPYFDREAIRDCLNMGPNYVEKGYEQELKDDNRNDEQGASQFDVLEYWGVMDAEYCRQIGMDIPEEIDDLDEVQVNAWVCNGLLLRAVVNPFTPFRLPYHAFAYEKNPYSFFGIGVAENMDDSQKIMNGHARMAIDNLALSGSLVFDVDESALAGGQSMEIYPGKVFRRQAGVPGTAINGLKFPNTSTENMMMFDKFRQLADEQTGIPSYSHGMTGVQSMTRTASGMSMLLGAASLNIKTVIKNLDDFLLKPLGEAYFQWNMQFLESKLNVEGDLEVRATGTNSLMQKEVRSQRLTMFLQTAQNPAIAPFIKINKLISELAYSLDLDPDELINDPEEAALMAQIIGLQNNVGQATGEEAGPDNQEQGAMGGPQAAPEQAQELGVTGTGGGNIGTGDVPQPGEDEFAG